MCDTFAMHKFQDIGNNEQYFDESGLWYKSSLIFFQDIEGSSK